VETFQSHEKDYTKTAQITTSFYTLNVTIYKNGTDIAIQLIRKYGQAPDGYDFTLGYYESKGAGQINSFSKMDE